MSVVLLLLISTTALAQRSALTVPRNIIQLSQQAATIIHGHVVNVRVEPHPQLQNLTTVVVTIRVMESFKGAAEATLTFRQFVWDLRDQRDGGGYRKGQELLLLLNGNSAYGLTSPAGMEQGRFEIFRSPKGIVTAANGQANVGLFANMIPQLAQTDVRLSRGTTAMVARHRSGPVPLSQLEELIKQFAGGTR